MDGSGFRRRACAVAALVVLLLSSAGAQARETLFERIGGESRLRAVVEEFTRVMEADPRINFTFANSDLEAFKILLYSQLCELTRGPCTYSGRNMLDTHAELNIDEAQFNALAEDLYEAFDRVGVPYRVQNEVMALLAPMEVDIVKPGAAKAARAPVEKR